MKIDAMYFCHSPYNIITAISLMKMNRENADLYIYATFSGAKECAERIKELGLFNSVIVMEWTLKNEFWNRSGILGKFQVVKNYFFTDKIVKRFLRKDTTYNRIYSIQKDLFSRTVFLNQLKHKIETEMIYYEEGDGVYTYDKATKNNKIDLIIKRMLFGKKAVKKNKLYVYSPELFKQLQSTQFELKKISFDKDSKTDYNEIFNFKRSDILFHTTIILDTICLSESRSNKLCELYRHIIDKLGYDNVILKSHPRAQKQREGFRLYTNTAVPFEIVTLNSNIRNKILIAYESTAVISPFLLYGDEPYVILLYKLLDQEDLNDLSFIKRMDMYCTVQSMYSNRERFFIPENLFELNEALDRVKKDNLLSWR